MLIDDIARNRYRVQSIMKRTADVMGEKGVMTPLLKQLAREKLISDEQYLKLIKAIDKLNSHQVAEIIKDTKVGQGMEFMPRKLSDLTKQLQIWLQELAETKTSEVRNKVVAVLEELLRRKDISQERYATIKDDNDI